jgi:hypothetical protein
VPLQPKKNDMSWGCYFVTGDVSYAQDVIAALKNLGERQDIWKYLTASSAQWSLSGIARDDATVRAALEQAAKGRTRSWPTRRGMRCKSRPARSGPRPSKS